jgi:hypothetical protein
MSFIQTVRGNYEGYTKREVTQAKEACRAQAMMGNPSENDYKGMVSKNYSLIAKCPISSKDISRRGARVGGSQSNVFNPTLRLFSHISCTRLHTTSDDDQTRRHKKHKQKTNTTTMVVEPLAPPAAWI